MHMEEEEEYTVVQTSRQTRTAVVLVQKQLHWGILKEERRRAVKVPKFPSSWIAIAMPLAGSNKVLP